MDSVGIREHGLVDTHRRSNHEPFRMGEGIGGQADEELGRKHHRRARSVVVSVEIFRVTFLACID